MILTFKISTAILLKQSLAINNPCELDGNKIAGGG